MFGFVVTTISGTVENIRGRAILYQRCLVLLRSYASDLRRTDSWLKEWESSWFERGNRQRARATYEYLWTRYGYEEIRNKMEDINAGFQAAQDMLRCRHASYRDTEWEGTPFRSTLRRPTEPNIVSWNNLLDEWRLPTQQHLETLNDNPKAGMGWKFRFAIYKNTLIKTEVSLLKDLVQQLKERCDQLFWTRFDLIDIHSQTSYYDSGQQAAQVDL
ncbi:hypothetical protein EJ08DRAFT_705626 [Tothia fuscella]|uniref:Uncharacterized protein n=1 Tax=Tothia fuscella TaxID=1048955 RepID=A0A9P4TTF0_9PEZI|nr:hypothetical protein EJ08DRAFT_705626 [Tothia fuscella]